MDICTRSVEAPQRSSAVPQLTSSGCVYLPYGKKPASGRDAELAFKVLKTLLPVPSTRIALHIPPSAKESPWPCLRPRAGFSIRLLDVGIDVDCLEGTCRAECSAAGNARRKWAKLEREKSTKD